MESTVTRNWGLTILRVVVGIVYLAHGCQKLFVYGFAGVQGAFGQMGIPAPAVMGPFITLLEFVGGILLIFGFLTSWVAILFALEMLVAIFKVHLPGGFFMPRGYEYALTLCAAAVALALAGPGAVALDHVVFAKHGLGRGTLIDPT